MTQTADGQKLYQQVAVTIADAIRAGRYVPGRRLPSERDLAEEFQVSRPTIREAMIALEIRGFIEARPGSGIYVTDAPPLEARAPEGPVARHVRTIEDRASPAADAAPVDESDERVLTGLWRQVEIDCAGRPQPSEPVRELEFRAPGRFWVTFVPFETYRDYWGQVDFDPAADRLALTIEGGNGKPENAILSGAARLEADGRRLVLEGFNLGNAHHDNSGWPCRYVFAR